MPKPPATNPYSIDDPKSDRLLVSEAKRVALEPIMKIAKNAVETSPPVTVGRTGLAAFLSTLLRLNDAKGDTLHSNDRGEAVDRERAGDLRQVGIGCL